MDTSDGSVDFPDFDDLATNEEAWVKLRDPKTGFIGWFQETGEGKIVPAVPTTKRF